ncbi:MAG TPA: hypothetical protein VMO26_10130 [Vicinamibacterales bacterium]|nr:hypothetical protein [Vicinamibacterales bacterium]
MFLRTTMVTALASLALAPAFGAAGMSSPVLTAAAAQAPCEPTVANRPAKPMKLRIVPVDLDDYGSSVSGPYAGSDTFESSTDVGPHAYFDALSTRSDCLVAYSLRSMDQLLAYMDATHKPIDVSYDPANDPDPRRQDAAKIVVPANVVSLPNNVRVPIPVVENDSLLVTWESWLGAEYAFAKTGIGNYKHFQFASGRIWTEIKSNFSGRNGTPPAGVADVEVRFYGQPEEGEIGPNVTNRHPASPMVGEFALQPETWTRYWVLIQPAGEWHEFSLWVADENRGPVLINDRLQIKPNVKNGWNGWNSFWLEYNTSSKGLDEGFGARVAYARNIVMLRGATNVQSLLQRPVK